MDHIHANQNAESRKKKTRNTKTRPALHRALLALLEEKSLEQITSREIAVRAGVGYATLFRHFPDKESLLNDLVAQEIRQLLAMTLPLLYTVDSRSSSVALCAFVQERRRLWTTFIRGGVIGVIKDEFIRQAEAFAVQNTKLNARIPSDLRVIVPVAGVLEMLAWWLKQSKPLTVQRMAELIDVMIVKPFSTIGGEPFVPAGLP